MLVLSRRSGERIVVGHDVTITVVEVGRGRVRLGIEAPADVVIMREEVQDRPRTAKDDSPARPLRTPRFTTTLGEAIAAGA